MSSGLLQTRQWDLCSVVWWVCLYTTSNSRLHYWQMCTTGTMHWWASCIVYTCELPCSSLWFHLACPIEGQMFTECGSSCPLTCDIVNVCTDDCWQGCECPSGMVIDLEQRRCVEPSQCRRDPPTVIARTSEDDRQCAQQFTCPFNTPQDDFYPCQYTLEVTEVFKGNNEVCKNFK